MTASRLNPPAGIGIIGCGRAADDLHLPAIARIEPRARLAHGVLFDGAGQIAGHVAWPGSSEDRLAAYEFLRVDHVTAADRSNLEADHEPSEWQCLSRYPLHSSAS